jgi:hypothetical protein
MHVQRGRAHGGQEGAERRRDEHVERRVRTLDGQPM